MTAAIRAADLADVDAMVGLSADFRAHLGTLSPVFWRPAPDASDRQASWLRLLLPLDETLAFVRESASQLSGFVIGRLTPAPPVYAPGGPICLVDDFCVAPEADWPEAGRALLEATEREARSRGAVLSVVVGPHLGGVPA